MNETHTSAGEKTHVPIMDDMTPTSSRSFQRIFYLAASFYFGAVFLRSILIYRDSPELMWVLGMLLVWLAFFTSEPGITRRWSGYFSIYLVIQTILVFILLSTPGYSDFFASLFAILSMQVMLHLHTKIGAAWIVLCALGMALLMAKVYKSQTIALVVIYTAGNVFYSTYSRATRRAQEARAQNQVLAQELEEANQKLQTYATQLEKLAVARERNRLARDLHDSVTQTVFSMTLTTQSASLLLERDSDRVEAQLDRLSQLARNALAEMQLLITELRPEETARGGLAATLRRYLADGRFSENLSVSLEVQGEQPVRPAEEQGLFHIVQEALNNIVKHAQASKARVRLHLSEPMWIEIEDWGQGFDLQQAQSSGRVGLLSMRERAAEIGWGLQIVTSTGAGTRVRVEKLPEADRQV
jgi:signal transduction histidine kinase